MESAQQPSRQKVVGVATREATARRVVDAAAAEFLERGYVRATVSRIAARAGVTVQTLYSAVGGKRDLLLATLRQALNPSPDAPYPDVLEERSADLDASQWIHEMAKIFRRIAERAAPFWSIYRDAAATDEQIAEDWRELQLARRGTIDRLVRPIADDRLHAGLNREEAIDTAWALMSPDNWYLLVTVAGRTPQQFEAWLTTALGFALVDPVARVDG